MNPQTATEQEIFNYVVSSVLKQGEPSVNGEGACTYRGESGTKCAAGFLIDDEEARFGGFIEPWAAMPTAKRLSESKNDLIEQLQADHDGAHMYDSEPFKEAFLKRVRMTAGYSELDCYFGVPNE